VLKKGGKPHTDKDMLDDAPQLTETAPKILHSKGCFEDFCETKMKIRIFGLIWRFGSLTVLHGLTVFQPRPLPSLALLARLGQEQSKAPPLWGVRGSVCCRRYRYSRSSNRTTLQPSSKII
jgi:hypothetical protein